jgi:mannose-6-phosphate isomerase-like protein (cupin superfamily)
MSNYTVKNLREVRDVAAEHGFGEVQEARFPRDDLEAESIGLAHIIVRPGKRQAFAHRHNDAEEVYVVLSGSGRIKLDDEIVEVSELDAIRIAPNVARALEAGDDGITILAFGPRHAGDAEIVKEEFWDG